jgi:primosomal protein N' (replication factor Y) (superfamily II helicase)
MKFYQIAVDTTFNQSILTYKSAETYSLGDIVMVPLRTSMVRGVILQEVEETQEKNEKSKSFETKEIKEQYPYPFKIEGEYLKFFQWVAKYYHYPVGKFIFDSLPMIAERKNKKKEKESGSDVEFKQQQLKINNEQARVLDVLRRTLPERPCLLHGVTGSGKSHVIVQLIKEQLDTSEENAAQILVLIPEINLTPQVERFFKEHLNCEILVYHSALTKLGRFEAWKRVCEKSARPLVVIGVRSALFLPFINLKFIVVDEEHDHSFKQDDRCHYNARDMALVRGKITNAPVLLASATPSFESYFRHQKTESYFKLTERAVALSLPDIHLIAPAPPKSPDWPLSEEIYEAIEKALKEKEQVLVFTSRLGFSQYLKCHNCQHQFECPNCSVMLRPFLKKKVLACHHCLYEEAFPKSCPKCGNLHLHHYGFGIEKITELVQKRFPSQRVDRFDRDEIVTFKQLTKKLDEFESGAIDILVGTQMLSKGHNFSKVNTVIMLGIDQQLNFPDFRARENALQLLTQMSGRAGRYSKKGQVFVVTNEKEHEIFHYVNHEDIELFYRDEWSIREITHYPPFKRMMLIHFYAKSLKEVEQKSRQLTKEMELFSKRQNLNLEILGPRSATIEKIANSYHWQTLIKSKDINNFHMLLDFLTANNMRKMISYNIDIDPLLV